MNSGKKLLDDIFIIDDFDLGRPTRTGTYVLNDEKLTLIETSASPSIPFILEGLQSMQIDPAKVQYIIVTHIHLDHAGGAGLLLQHCPNATLIVHPKGARHLIDPSRLIAGAKAVYGTDFDRLFDPIIPVPEDRMEVKNDGDYLEISAKRTLTFYDTPGHANHHFSIFDPVTNSMFTGDTAGVTYPELHPEGINLYLPSTSPNQFDPEKMLHSIQLYEQKQVSNLFFGHFGLVTEPNKVYKEIRNWLSIFVQTAEDAYQNHSEIEKQKTEIFEKLYNLVCTHLKTNGFSEPNHPIWDYIRLDIDVSSMGLVDYMIKKMKSE